MHELEEIMMNGYESAKIYKERKNKYHDKQLVMKQFYAESKSTFQVNDQRLKIYLENIQREEDPEEEEKIIYLKDASMDTEGLGFPSSLQTNTSSQRR